MSPAAFHSDAEREFALNLGEWIYELRRARSVSQRRLGLVAGAHLNTVRNWEQGDSMPNPYQVELLKRFAKQYPVMP